LKTGGSNAWSIFLRQVVRANLETVEHR